MAAIARPSVVSAAAVVKLPNLKLLYNQYREHDQQHPVVRDGVIGVRKDG
jgi:hypothetical protein